MESNLDQSRDRIRLQRKRKLVLAAQVLRVWTPLVKAVHITSSFHFLFSLGPEALGLSTLFSSSSNTTVTFIPFLTQ